MGRARLPPDSPGTLHNHDCIAHLGSMTRVRVEAIEPDTPRTRDDALTH